MKFWLAASPLFLIGLSGFGLGYFSSLNSGSSSEPLCVAQPYQEISIIKFKALRGDQLALEISGPVRLVWNDDFVEGDGEHLVALGQLPSDGDKNFRTFAYTGNAGTMKFYPSNTYAARGTAPEKRRFFATKTDAEKAGFIPSKLVK